MVRRLPVRPWRDRGDPVTVSVCIPATRAAGLGSAVRSVLAQTWTDWELLVLGQGDAGPEAAMRAATLSAAGEDARVRYLHLARRGLSGARNAAFREARGEVVAFLDDDCEADPAWLATIASAFEADPTLGAVGGAVIPAGPVGPLSSCPELTPSEAVYDPAVTPQRPPAGWDWIGANFAVRIVLADRAGAWDVHLGGGAEFPAGEDTDYKLRLEALGVRMLTTPRSVVRHSSGTRSGREALRSQRNYALGNGALAAKQTLAGDPRGRLWLRQTRRACLTDWLVRRRPHRLPVDLRRGLWFEVGYRRCRRGYAVDDRGLLRPRVVPVAGGSAGVPGWRDAATLVSFIDPGAVRLDRHDLRTWLERRQARRSALLLVPDRATGMRFAARWKLDLSRMRVAPDPANPPAELVERCLMERAARGRRPTPWHAV